VKKKLFVDSRSLGWGGYVWSQAIAAILLIAYTLLLWLTSQTADLRMELAVPLVVLPLEGAAIVLALFTLQEARREYQGGWAVLGFFRLVLGLQLPQITWSYHGAWGTPTAIPSPTIAIAELLLGCYTLLWLFVIWYRLRRSAE
jgi:hypothetical protein